MSLPKESEERMEEGERQNPREQPIFESAKKGVALKDR